MIGDGAGAAEPREEFVPVRARVDDSARGGGPRGAVGGRVTLDAEAFAGQVAFLDALTEFVVRVSSESADSGRVPPEVLGRPPVTVSLVIFEDDPRLVAGPASRDRLGRAKLPDLDDPYVAEQGRGEVLLHLALGRITRATPGAEPDILAVLGFPTLTAILRGRAVVRRPDGTTGVREPFGAGDALRLGLLDGPNVFAAVGILSQLTG